jgi:hypothetical protein
VYDYLLGGAHHVAVDRALGDRLRTAQPTAQQNRAFSRRAVLFQVNAGIRQFLDIGPGIRTVGNVPEIVQRLAPHPAAADALRGSQDPACPRTHREFVDLFAGLEVVEPAVVPAPRWRPERPGDAAGAQERCGISAGVGRRR